MPLKNCSTTACARPVKARGLCSIHYDLLRKSGDPQIKTRRRFEGVCKDCGGGGPFYGFETSCSACRNKQSTKWRADNLERSREQSNASAKRKYASLRKSVLQAYGGKCTCCNETHPAFLVVDHIPGGGRAHLRELGGSGAFLLYRWLSKNNYPQGFQILCHNCNFAKSNGGCPHAATS